MLDLIVCIIIPFLFFSFVDNDYMECSKNNYPISIVHIEAFVEMLHATPLHDPIFLYEQEKKPFYIYRHKKSDFLSL
jgi:hypothetical protein